ncbi:MULTISPECIES: hypothetical protein [unclassified Microbispora]|uniref:hypothetical protein n=1 Tax=unclassified Microbispora TaxID=2614687 RepID=UPI0011571AAD|nr:MULTISPECIES: hypothetical protein [unclassified Microbispora]NJP26806.1 hypothetical protein [Microbispora sp. CL1-1]
MNGIRLLVGREYRRYDDRVVADSQFIERFCRQVETRSDELERALPLLIEHEMWILAGSVLRMQVESLARAVFLLNDPVATRELRVERSFSPGLDGRFPELPPRRGIVQDTAMVRLADEMVPGLKHSATSMYIVGCKLVHLSAAHEYHERDPYQALSIEQRHQFILDPLAAVWGSTCGLSDDSTFVEVMTVASPRAFRKLGELLRACVKRLRDGESLDPSITYASE